MLTAKGRPSASGLLALTFYSVTVACAPSHPTYSRQPFSQVTTYLDAHCPRDSHGIAHYYALIIADARVDVPSVHVRNSKANDQYDADGRQLDRLLAMCAATTDDAWVHDAASLMLASDYFRSEYVCPSPGAEAESTFGLDEKFLCQRDVTSNRIAELNQLLKTSHDADIRSIATQKKIQAEKDLLDEECGLSADYRNVYKPRCPPDPLEKLNKAFLEKLFKH
jgi:hypothetical protein